MQPAHPMLVVMGIHDLRSLATACSSCYWWRSPPLSGPCSACRCERDRQRRREPSLCGCHSEYCRPILSPLPPAPLSPSTVHIHWTVTSSHEYLNVISNKHFTYYLDRTRVCIIYRQEIALWSYWRAVLFMKWTEKVFERTAILATFREPGLFEIQNKASTSLQESPSIMPKNYIYIYIYIFVVHKRVLLSKRIWWSTVMRHHTVWYMYQFIPLGVNWYIGLEIWKFLYSKDDNRITSFP